MGRPRGSSPFSQEIRDKICAQLAEGRTLTSICSDPGMPSVGTVIVWTQDKENIAFYKQYSRAREVGYLKMADELLDIIDDGRNDWMTIKRGQEEVEVVNREAVERSKLRFAGRQWLLSKALPKIYGDKLAIDAKVGPTEAFRQMWEALGKGKIGEVPE